MFICVPAIKYRRLFSHVFLWFINKFCDLDVQYLNDNMGNKNIMDQTRTESEQSLVSYFCIILPD